MRPRPHFTDQFHMLREAFAAAVEQALAPEFILFGEKLLIYLTNEDL